ncbi:AAA family ATPase [Nitrosophilus alvini]|uniref:AAA family ATPase n=1 Tax=Nitrosophilus alvini TaxID=2714855 RepID=UPI00190B1ECD|nr:ATPase [Nitrosophilus alvini]
MIERLYIKSYFSFEEVAAEFKRGLVVFTGPSGAGKSLLINSILSLTGFKPAEAKLSEIVFADDMDLEKYGIERDDIVVVKGIKKEKTRFFINSQSVPKRVLNEIFASKVSFLSQKDTGIFKSKNILEVLDLTASKNFPGFSSLKKSYTEEYKRYTEVLEKLERIYEEEKKVNDLIEFAKFEIEKIDEISPKTGELEELYAIKKDLSKKEKIEEAVSRAQLIFESEYLVNEALQLLDIDSSFFDETMNELRNIFENSKEMLLELENIDVEEVLDRIEKLSDLKRRYGSIEEALEYRNKKIMELERYQNLSFEKRELEDYLKKSQESLEKMAEEISEYRKKSAQIFEEKINSYTALLKLPAASVQISHTELSEYGRDKASIELEGVGFDKISSGEFNRLRLAFLASSPKDEKGVLILDEIDANLSGEESMGVAKVLKELSKKYQIFAISHQAQLPSVADQHFLVYKDKGESCLKELTDEERVFEIARIVSGEKVTEEAVEFAKKVLKENG